MTMLQRVPRRQGKTIQEQREAIVVEAERLFSEVLDEFIEEIEKATALGMNDAEAIGEAKAAFHAQVQRVAKLAETAIGAGCER
jgi:hypothetical protein